MRDLTTSCLRFVPEAAYNLPGMIPGPGFFSGAAADWWEAEFSGAGMASDFAGDQYMSNEVDKAAITDLFGISRSTVGTAVDTAGLVVKFATGIMRRTNKGLLIERQRANICLQSEDLTTTWVGVNSDIDSTTETAPDGTSTADEIAADETLDQIVQRHQSFTGRTAAESTVVTWFGKPGTNATLVQLAYDIDGTGGDGFFCNFDLSAGTKGTVTAMTVGTATSAAITAHTNGYFRIEIIGAITTGTLARVTIGIVDVITAAKFEAADLTINDSIIGWGADIGAGETFSSSYIPTTTGPLTRNADVINGDTAMADWYDEGIAFTTYHKGCTEFEGGEQIYYRMLASASNWTIFNKDNGSTTTRFDVRSTGVGGGGSERAGSLTFGVVHKGAIRVKVDDTIGYMNGSSTDGEDTTISLPIGMDNIDIGAGGTDNFMGGYLETLVYFPTAKTNTELATLTTL